MVRIRGARPSDWPAVAEILAQAGLENVIGGPDEGIHARVFETFLSRSDVVVLIAHTNGRALGYLGMEIRTRLTRAAPEAWIPNLAVADDQRVAVAWALPSWPRPKDAHGPWAARR